MIANEPGPLRIRPETPADADAISGLIGIGSALVLAGIGQLRSMSAAGCVVLGDPAYYGRIGRPHDGGPGLPRPSA